MNTGLNFYMFFVSNSNHIHIDDSWCAICNVAISIGCSWLFLGCDKIFDFGILRIICLEIKFLMIITSEPINVMSMHMTKWMLSFLKLK